jgi:hypothetical protein
MYIDGEVHRHVNAPPLLHSAMGALLVFDPLVNLEGTCGPDPRCNIGRSLGEADADAPH